MTYAGTVPESKRGMWTSRDLRNNNENKLSCRWFMEHWRVNDLCIPSDSRVEINGFLCLQLLFLVYGSDKGG